VASYTNLFVLLLSLLTAGCIPNYTKQEQLQKQANLENMVPCPDDRPLSCKDDKKPVCGIFSDGATFDYDSACIACTRTVIIGYLPGRCK